VMPRAFASSTCRVSNPRICLILLPMAFKS
jgi:hypothetical protein